MRSRKFSRRWKRTHVISSFYLSDTFRNSSKCRCVYELGGHKVNLLWSVCKMLLMNNSQWLDADVEPSCRLIMCVFFSAADEQPAWEAVHQEQGGSGVRPHLHHGVSHSVAQVLLRHPVAGRPEPSRHRHLPEDAHGHRRGGGGPRHPPLTWGETSSPASDVLSPPRLCFKFISRALKEESWRECWSQPTVGIISDESDLLIRLNAVLKRKKKKLCLNSNKRIYSDVCEKLPSLPQTSSCIHVNTLTYRWIIDYLFSVAVGLFACVWHFYLLHSNQQRNKERDISSDWMLRERKRRCGTTNWGRSKSACEPRVAPAAVRDSDDRLDQID